MKNDDQTAEDPLAQYEKPLNFDQVWKMFQETDRMFQETDKKLNKLESLFTSQWGKLVELLVEGDLIRMLNGKGIKVESTLQRIKGNRDGQNFEFDIIAENLKEIVIVEVKTTLRQRDVTEFLEKLRKSKRYLPKYKGMDIYGAMAFITADGHSDRMAENMGLFVIRATGSSAAIVNKDGFKPIAF